MNPENTQNVMLVLALGDLGPIAFLLPAVSSSTIRSLDRWTSGEPPAGIQGVARGKKEGVESMRQEPGSGIRKTFSSSYPPLGISGANPKERWDLWKVLVGREGLGSRPEAMHNDNALGVCKPKPHSCPCPFFPTGVRELPVLSLVTTVCELEVGLQIQPHSLLLSVPPQCSRG